MARCGDTQGQVKDGISQHANLDLSILGSGFPEFTKEVGNHGEIFKIGNGSFEDQRIDVEVIYVIGNESSHSFVDQITMRVWKYTRTQTLRKFRIYSVSLRI